MGVSDHLQHVVFLDIDLDAAKHVADEVQQWLLTSEVIDGTPPRFGPGARWATAVTALDTATPSGHVDVIVGRHQVDAGEAVRALECPACGHRSEVRSAADFKTLTAIHTSLAEAWQQRGEPSVACPRCKQRRRYGDWPGAACAIGNLTVSFANWPADLAPTFVSTLRTRFNARLAVIDERL